IPAHELSAGAIKRSPAIKAERNVQTVAATRTGRTMQTAPEPIAAPELPDQSADRRAPAASLCWPYKQTAVINIPAKRRALVGDPRWLHAFNGVVAGVRRDHQLASTYATQPPPHANASMYTNCTMGHFQVRVSRLTMASVLMHCMANT